MAYPSAIRSSAASSSRLEARLIADTNHEPAWSGLEIDRVTIAHRLHEISSTHLLLNPFSVLMSLRLAHGEPRPKALVVMPMSGGHVLMIRDLVCGLLQTHDVAVLDWINARHVPCSAGRFGFRENLGSAIDALIHLGAGVHLIGICQSGPVAALVASLLHQAGSDARPASLALLCSPIDPWAEQTRVASLLAGTAESWLAGSLLSPVPSTYMGHGRMVYPAELHQARLLQYLKNHLLADTVIGRKITADDGLEAGRFPFLTRITRIKDIAGAAFTESISAIYHDRVLWSGGLQVGGKRIRPQTVRDLALVTVEAEGDDITAPGQTVAAHRLFARVPDRRREHLLIDDGCHFSPFHGKAAREDVVPALAAFMSATER
jgi:poly(3-hydroxybutyrate) depolymerase